ncbi:hypothetical protein Y032_0026g1311 [Ancylostoma ceylanicum]|uniref:Uncharacterized protein n=1 Tax=Ancylostoma ceylanicum TaxID=53326 RepID=A0A016UUN9_9BILA|nr:hypothetical protein Y032_0026g1311 [Ancylostoma ceylanicum]
MCPPWPVVWKTTEYGSDDGGWVRLGPVVRKAPTYWSADRGVRKAPEYKSTEWGWVHHASSVRKTTEYGSPMEDGSGRGPVV